MKTKIFLAFFIILALTACNFTWNNYWTPNAAGEITVSLQSPADGATVSMSTPTFQWQSNITAAAYQLLIDDNVDFASPLVDKNDIKGTSYTLTVAGGEVLLAGITYYWKVRAQDAEGTWWSWSGKWSVSVIDIRQGLIGEWLFNGNADDTSGNGNHGTVHGSTLTTDRFGNAATAYSFDGIDDNIEILNSSTNIELQSYSISAWIRNEKAAIIGRIFSNGDWGTYTGSVDFALSIQGGNKLLIINQTGTEQTQYRESGTTISNEWTNVIVTYDSTNYNTMLFVNGVQVAASMFEGTYMKLPNPDSPLNYHIGSMGDTSYDFWGGKIDDVRVYSRVLSSAEIQMLYSEGGWNENFNRIVFTSTRDNTISEIYTMNPDGSDVIRLTNDTCHDQNPKWSPDRTKIAFDSDRNGNVDIYIMNPDGSNLRRITTDLAYDAFPDWSPDGNKIAFGTRRNADVWDIYVMNTDGANQIRLTADPAEDYYPRWSPDGSKIAFTSHRNNNFDIYTMNADGSNQIRITTDPAIDDMPCWSADGQKVTFSSNRTGNYEVWVMSNTGTNPLQLTSNPGTYWANSWAVCSIRIDKILFRSQRDVKTQLYSMNLDGSNQINISNNSYDDGWYGFDW